MMKSVVPAVNAPRPWWREPMMWIVLGGPPVSSASREQVPQWRSTWLEWKAGSSRVSPPADTTPTGTPMRARLSALKGAATGTSRETAATQKSARGSAPAVASCPPCQACTPSGTRSSGASRSPSNWRRRAVCASAPGAPFEAEAEVLVAVGRAVPHE